MDQDSTAAQEQAEAISRRLFAAITSGDLDTVKDLYAPDSTIWNNYTPGTIGVDGLVAMLGHLQAGVERMWFEPGRTQATANGFVDQHVTHFVTKKGVTVSLASCMVATVRDGRIATVEEYANPADLAPLIAELSESARRAMSERSERIISTARSAHGCTIGSAPVNSPQGTMVLQ